MSVFRCIQSVEEKEQRVMQVMSEQMQDGERLPFRHAGLHLVKL